MPEIRVILIRHGQRQKISDAESDEKSTLTPEGAKEAEKLAVRLNELSIAPVAYFTSAYEHAKQTAKILSKHVTDSKIIYIDALTPHTPEERFTLDNIRKDAADHQVDLNSVDTIALVGHENRLSQLITLMTGARLRPLDLLDVVCVRANDFQTLQLGRAEILWRIPVKAYEEAALRPKVASKMTVATLLAGFSFTALLQILTSIQMPTLQDLTKQQAPAEWLNCAIPLLSTICLTAALALFIAVVYIYDRLSMPEGLWATARASKWQKLPKTVQENKDQYGLVYGYMLHTWRFVFTPGVLLAAVGFLMIVVGKSSDGLSVLYVIILLVVSAYYWKVRPQLGVD